MATNPRLIDMALQRIGRWEVLSKAGNTPKGGALWFCKCDCGTLRTVLGVDLRKGKSVSCGCENLQRLGRAARKHAGKGTRLYTTWKGMRARCNNPKHPRYADWGGRGIKVCAEWDDFSTFQSWAFEAGYTDSLSIERRDNALGYGPSNCTWATPLAQSRNRSIVRRNPDGVPWCEIAERHGIPTTLMNGRIHDGWPVEKAATHPKQVRGTKSR